MCIYAYHCSGYICKVCMYIYISIYIHLPVHQSDSPQQIHYFSFLSLSSLTCLKISTDSSFPKTYPFLQTLKYIISLLDSGGIFTAVVTQSCTVDKDRKE